MAKSTTQYTCSDCGHREAKWAGKCQGCGSYNTLEESVAPTKPGRQAGSIMGYSPTGARRSANTLQTQRLDDRKDPPPRHTTGHPELDRALGGGLVEASVVLIGGDPGIGKSTLLLQMAAAASATRRVVYISGEESQDQIQLRAQRLGVHQSSVDLVTTNDCLAIADFIETLPQGSVVIVDSVQVLNAGADSAPGSVTQVKQSAAHLIPAAKATGVTLVLVSHVTKEGSLAGPNVLMHAVDATIYVEADSSAGIYRLVRAEKNRFGPANEVGVFEMTDRGMIDVDNPSKVFIAQRDPTAFGTIIYPSLEGSRPLLLEVQALVAPTSLGTARRSANGWDAGRMNMLLATMSARLGLPFVDSDIYVNVAGGLKITDPAMDLAVAAALLSARYQIALPADLAIFGEVGLSGEVRNSSRAEARIKEASQLGLNRIICPEFRDQSRASGAANCNQVRKLSQLIRVLPDIREAFAA